MAARKTATRRTTKKTTAPAKCSTCNGTGETTTEIRVGRGRRATGHHQTGLCPDCFGSGLAST
ncbi:hypothetical protein Z951_37410 [Streptomyces sp. PRh5]|uniref:hypothetical protein n=1 Tax=Streptomyces sp. PRh5 TaxID=1158056 RepID=UPI000445275B|nr:hypothetical protein [Streptomyces sp. PRh5]EXU63158.1 hypothetical protein Z951_37410 [Streptomyces sp. PRh5]